MSGVASGCLVPDREGIVANEKENVKGLVGVCQKDYTQKKRNA